jgi:hypothetical protein
MPTIQVQPRDTPAEKSLIEVEVEVDEELELHAETIGEWVANRQNWEFTLREGTEFGRTNNVEGRLLFAAGEQTSSLTFRLDQLDSATDTGPELVLQLETEDGIGKLVRVTPNGLDVEFFHILTHAVP